MPRTRPPVFPGGVDTATAAVSRASAAVPAAICLAAAACGPGLAGAPVPRPFPSPAAAVAGNGAAAHPPAAVAGGGADFTRYLDLLEEAETGGDCFARPAGSSALGCYQMTRAALTDAGLKDAGGGWLDNPWGVDSDDEFQGSRPAQADAVLRYTTSNWRRLEPCVRDLIGATVGGVTLDQGALVAGAHLLGPTGLVRFVRCGLHARCIAAPAARLNGGAPRLHAAALRRMRDAQGLRILQSPGRAGSRCRLPT